MIYEVGQQVRATPNTHNAPLYLSDQVGVIIDHSGSVDTGEIYYVVDFEKETHFLPADDLETLATLRDEAYILEVT